MNILDIFIFSVYSDANGKLRKVTKFFDGLDGDRRVKYSIGFFTDDGRWYSSGATFECSKKHFARWAKSKVKAGHMCRHGADSSICTECNSETYTVEQASQKAVEWCDKNKGWKRICDIEDSDSLYKTWDELPKKIKKYWIDEYGEYSAENAWREFGESYCKVPKGFITGKGEFYENVLDVPRLHNLMMVFKIG